MVAEIVPLRPSPSLQDIPNQLRQLANAIEAGDHGEVECVFALIPHDGDFPTMFGWGDVTGKNEPIVQLELAKAWFVQNRTARR